MPKNDHVNKQQCQTKKPNGQGVSLLRHAALLLLLDGHLVADAARVPAALRVVEDQPHAAVAHRLPLARDQRRLGLHQAQRHHRLDELVLRQELHRELDVAVQRAEAPLHLLAHLHRNVDLRLTPPTHPHIFDSTVRQRQHVRHGRVRLFLTSRLHVHLADGSAQHTAALALALPAVHLRQVLHLEVRQQLRRVGHALQLLLLQVRHPRLDHY